MKRQGLLSVTGILMLGLIVLMTLHEWGNPLDASERQAILSAPAIIARDVTAKSYQAKTGKVQYKLTASHLEQFDQNPKTLLTNPDLHLENKQGTWTIQSKNGEVLDNGGLIVFKNDVQAHSESKDLTLKTDELRYHSDTRTVDTPSQVNVRHQRGSTRAGGMHVNLDSGEMNLKKGVVSDFNGTRR